MRDGGRERCWRLTTSWSSRATAARSGCTFNRPADAQRLQRRAVRRPGRTARGRPRANDDVRGRRHHRDRRRRSARAPTSPGSTPHERVRRARPRCRQPDRPRRHRLLPSPWSRQSTASPPASAARPPWPPTSSSPPSPPAFLLAFARIGLMPDGGYVGQRSPPSIGRARAMRMALLAEPLTGAGGRTTRGLVSHVAPDDGLPRRWSTRSSAGSRAGRSPRPGRHQEGGQRGHPRPARGRPRRASSTGQTILLRTDDVAEGMRAFSRAAAGPDFRGS